MCRLRIVDLGSCHDGHRGVIWNTRGNWALHPGSGFGARIARASKDILLVAEIQKGQKEEAKAMHQTA